jgi:hypothetical protein
VHADLAHTERVRGQRFHRWVDDIVTQCHLHLSRRRPVDTQMTVILVYLICTLPGDRYVEFLSEKQSRWKLIELKAIKERKGTGYGRVLRS